MSILIHRWYIQYEAWRPLSSFCIALANGPENVLLSSNAIMLFLLWLTAFALHLHYLEQDIVIAAAKLTEFYRQQLSFLFTGKNLFSALKEESLLGCIKIYL
jgi:hypothetical protein